MAKITTKLNEKHDLKYTIRKDFVKFAIKINRTKYQHDQNNLARRLCQRI